MKIPTKISDVNFDRILDWGYPYPPTSFTPILEHQLGNGDMFGLYWPVGKEDEDPLVLEMRHDSFEMSPQFSSLDCFIAGSKSLGDDDDFLHATQENDKKSPVVLLTKAKELLANGEVDLGIELLKLAINVLPEYTQALCLLALMYRRQKKDDLAMESALKAFMCSPSFGQIDQQLWQWFCKQSNAPDTVANDPLWKHRHEISWVFGNEKKNDTYLVLQKVMDEYLSKDMIIEWFLMSQTYSEYMYRETSSFQERYSFDSKAWRLNQLEKYAELTGVVRDATKNLEGKVGSK
jgi:tetratricopeptide (TPR) repeat protein